MQDLLAAFLRRWFISLALGVVVGGVAGAALWFTAPPQTFTARTWIYVASLNPVILGDTPDTRVSQSYHATQLALARSRPVLNAALSSPKVKDISEIQKDLDPVAWLEKKISVNYESAEIMRISMNGPDSKILPNIVEAVRDAYLTVIVDKEYIARVERLDLLKDLYAKHELALKTKRDELKTLGNGLGSTNPQLVAIRQEFAWKELHSIQSELLQVQSQLRRAYLDVAEQGGWMDGMQPLSFSSASAVGLAGSSSGNGPLLAVSAYIAGSIGSQDPIIPDVLLDEYLKKDGDYDRLAKQVKLLEKERDFVVASFKEPAGEKSYKRIMSDLADAKKSLADCRNEIRPRISRQAREKLYGELAYAKQNAQAGIEKMRKLEALLLKEVEDRAKANQTTSKQSIDLEWLKDDIAARDGTGKRLRDQIEALKVELSASKRIKSMNDTAVYDDSDKRLRTSGMGLLGGFAVSVLGVTYLEFRARKVHHPDELTEGLQLKLLGTMPVLSQQAVGGKKNQASEANRRFQKYLVESVDATRLVLLHATRHESMRVLQTTSAFGGEGKTMLSCHLAVNLATAGYRTLLIDADLRRPAVYKVFHAPNEPGLCEVLRGDIDLAAALRPGPVTKLSLLLAGDCQDQPTQLLTQGSFGTLLSALRQQYDYIIVDSAPLLPVVDSQYIAQHVDGVIMSVIKNKSRLPAVHAACDRLSMFDVRILGVVVHGVTNDSYYHDYAIASPKTRKTYPAEAPKT